jgi:hypothetical protein
LETFFFFFCWGWPGTMILLISASQAARITARTHRHPAHLLLLLGSHNSYKLLYSLQSTLSIKVEAKSHSIPVSHVKKWCMTLAGFASVGSFHRLLWVSALCWEPWEMLRWTKCKRSSGSASLVGTQTIKHLREKVLTAIMLRPHPDLPSKGQARTRNLDYTLWL